MAEGLKEASEIYMTIEDESFLGDFKATMEGYTEMVEAFPKGTHRVTRMKVIDHVLNLYVERTGERPDNSILSRLSDVILRDELTNQSRTKNITEEYPFLSETQKSRRKAKNNYEVTSLGVVNREVPLKHAKNVALDGKDYSLPIRWFIDREN
jgi:hypothetical protein